MYPLLRASVEALNSGRLEAARGLLHDLHEQSPEHPAVAALIASYFERQNWFSAAASWFRHAVELGSDDPAVSNNAAMAEFLSGHRDVALRLWRECLERWPGHAGINS